LDQLVNGVILLREEFAEPAGARLSLHSANDEALFDEPPAFSIVPVQKKCGCPPKYANMFQRLVANTQTPNPDKYSDNACWLWTGKKGLSPNKKRPDHYGRLTIWVPMLHKRKVFSAHVVMAILQQIGYNASANEIYQANQAFLRGGKQIDHMCDRDHAYMPDPPDFYPESCINPDHLQVVTPQKNIQLRDLRRAGQEVSSTRLDFPGMGVPSQQIAFKF
jgi:hypothetical protein